MRTIILEGTPLSTNHIYRKRGNGFGMYMTEEGKSLKESYYWQAKKQWGREKPLQRELELWVTIYHQKKGKKDWDNFNKLWSDSLSGIVYVDDSQIMDVHLSKRFDAEKPRIEIEIV